MPEHIANIIGWDNGRGLSRDIDLLAESLIRLGWIVYFNGSPVRSAGGSHAQQFTQRLRSLFAGPPFDVNIHLEHPRRPVMWMARRNLLVPNQEWFLDKYHANLRKIDRVLAKTQHAADIFSALGCEVDLIGWAGVDRRRPAKTVRGALHVAGHSKAKGTDAILDVWSQHPEWPMLTVLKQECAPRPASNIRIISDRLSDDEVVELQNQHLIHVATSEAEGYGHSIVEAMSVGACVITTDAAPMNELVTPERGFLVRTARVEKMRLGYRHFVCQHDLEATLSKVLSMPQSALTAIGQRARKWVVTNNLAFPNRLGEALAKLDRVPLGAIDAA